uniref:Mastermind like transcriptional coactivator 2 n=1 Tax=Leptobrachium leishanense TaxID=445787 RepID=A0A8C5LV01_9ANUR
MGETAPLQTTAGSLGIVGVGGLLGGGTVAPRVHSAIVERLRARIAACREHHRSCQGRYERGRAESSDRERENTLQLLTLVQHGQGTRKTSKHIKNPPPPDYHHHQQQHQLLLGASGSGNELNGDRQTSNGLDQRNSALIALQGSLKRRLVVNVSSNHSKKSNGITENSFLDFKKIRANEHLPGTQNAYRVTDGLKHSTNGSIPVQQAEPRKFNASSSANCNTNDMFCLTLKDIKKEPGESLPCSKHTEVPMSQDNLYRYGDDLGEPLIDPDLQELFNELTYISVPPMSDSELQNMINITIKQDEPFNIDIGQNHRTTPTSLAMDKVVIKSEYPHSLDHCRVDSPQLRPPSTGPTYSMASTSLTTSLNTSGSQVQVSSSTNRLPSWQELSHAQQLKQMAANRQHTITQHHQPGQLTNWSNVPPVGSTSRPFGQEKIPSPFRQQQFSPHRTSMSAAPPNGSQPKVINSYLYKTSPNSQSSQLDMVNQQKPQDSNKNPVNSNHSSVEPHPSSTKTMFHFNSDQANHQVPSVLNPQSKSILQFTQQQQAAAAPQQHEPLQQSKPGANQNLQRTQAFQHKMLIPKIEPNQQISGLHYQPTHQQQEKSNSQDQLNRHLSRPPPDYKDQRRTNMTVQPGTQYSAHNVPPQHSGHSSANHGSKISPSLQGPQSIYGTVQCPQQPMYNVNPGVNHIQQQTSPSSMATSQNTHVLSRQSTGNGLQPFGTGTTVNPLQLRSGSGQGTSMVGQRAPNGMVNSSATQSWVPPDSKKQDAACFTNNNQFPNQSLQNVLANQHFPQRSLPPSNQIPQGIQMRPLTQMSQGNNGQTIESLRGLNRGQSQPRTPILPSLSPSEGSSTMMGNTFTSANPTSRSFQGTDTTNDLGSFDFLSQNSGLGSALNSDSDFIDALLKTGHINDDWMKDINLDDIFKNNS